MGKGWAQGLTAATDPRVARAAAGHRGKQYVRRTPRELCRWPLAGLTTLPLAWSDDMAYIVGLTATDGCLVTGRRAINFKSSDRELVETYLQLLGRTNRVKSHPTKTGGIAYYTQFLLPLARGLLDGDGSIINKVYRADTGRRPDYFWEYLITSFNSASGRHIQWLQGALGRVLNIKGSVQKSTTTAGNPYFELRYAKAASSILLPLLYPAGAPCLERKREIWHAYVSRHGPALS
jgi:hypothetical protein